MTTLARLPFIATDIECVIVRHVRMPEIHVASAQLVEPDTIIATAAVGPGRAVRIPVAAELGVAPDEAPRCLLRPLGERVEAGEAIAGRRRGLRETHVTSPIAGRLVSLDQRTGTLLVVAEAPRSPVKALVAGEVVRTTESSIEIKTIGDLISGAALLGPESGGTLVILADRPDRELPAEEFDERCRGAVVVAGLTVSSAALRRLSELGAAGVVVGSVSIGTLEPFLGERTAERLEPLLAGSSLDWPFPFGILVLEGFGRLPIPEPAFTALQEHAGRSVALFRGESLPIGRPGCFATSRSLHGKPLTPVPLTPGNRVHIRIPGRPGIGQLRSDPFLAREHDGLAFHAALVERNGRTQPVPVEWLDPLP